MNTSDLGVRDGSGEKKKIAVLGGGMGSLAAVYHLTSQPDWEKEYEITVYQLGWRLGGKAASGRNRKIHDRNEEDGIHVFFGYYANALAMMRDCYEELGRPKSSPLATFGEALKPLDFSVIEERMSDGSWVHWPLCPPFGLGRNGSGEARQGDLSIGDVLLSGVRTLLDQTEALCRLVPGAFSLRSAADALERILSPGRGSADASNAYGLVNETWHRALEPVLAAAELAAVTVWTFNQDFIRLNDALARAWISFNFNFALVRGIVRDRVLVRGIRSINDRDFAEWIGDHAVDDGGLTRASAFVRVPYSTFFAYENGDNNRPSIEAGTALRILLLGMLCHRGVAYWKMQAGTGDTVFAPLYQVLVKRGVRFEFFRRVEKLETSRDEGGRRVESVVLRSQATVCRGEDYEPLYDVKGLPCWPSEPLYEQLEEGADLEEDFEKHGVDLESWWSKWSCGTSKLRAGTDFDTLILGIGLGALPWICSELTDDERWRRMFDTQKTVRTVALQLWTRKSLSELGWPPCCLYPRQAPVLSTFDRQATGTLFNTWLQMDQILERENWPEDAPRGLAYFCGKMHDDSPLELGEGPPQDLHRRVLRSVERFLRLNLPHLWPGASEGPGHFDFQVLRSGAGAVGHKRVEDQYSKANVNPSDRYVQTVVDSSRHRLKTGDSGCSNLFLVGDWIDNGLNVGSIEAAVMAGMLCSHAVSGQPGLDEIRHLNFLDVPYED